jgi:hypothetical protein
MQTIKSTTGRPENNGEYWGILGDTTPFHYPGIRKIAKQTKQFYMHITGF